MSGYGAPVAFERPVLFEPGDPSGVEPVRMHDARARSPARGKAQGRNAFEAKKKKLRTRTADGSRSPEATSASFADLPLIPALMFLSRAVRSARRKPIGPDGADQRQVGPVAQK